MSEKAIYSLVLVLYMGLLIIVGILILDRSRELGGKNEQRKDVFFVEASSLFRSATAQSVMADEHIDAILDAVEKRQDIERFCRVVQPDEIEENDYNLNITRYVDTFEEEEEVDIEANLKEMAEIDAELVKLEKEMAGHLRELGIVNGE